MRIDWPLRWQSDARDALEPYLGSDSRLRIIVGPPTSVDGTVLDGFVYLDGRVPMIIHDRSGRADVYAWQLLAGPVLRIYELRPRSKPSVLYAHPDWTPRHGD